MIKSIIKRYKFPESFDEGLFQISVAKDESKLRKYGLICLGVNPYSPNEFYYSPNEFKYLSSYFHHDSGASLIVNNEYEEIYLVGSESSINKTKKDLESLTCKLEKAKTVKNIRYY